MNFCSRCGEKVYLQVPEGDNRSRYVCEACNTIHYQNPKIVTGCVVEWNGRILLCRRAIEPGMGLWTLPAGFMENGETAHAGAMREALEEANAQIEIDDLYTLFNLPRINQVHIHFRGRLLNPAVCPGTESLEVDLFTEQEIPWEGIAFHVIHETLKYYFQDRRAGCYRMRSGTIEHPSLSPGGHWFKQLRE